MFVSKTTPVRLHLRMCLRAQRNDAILYGFGRILSGANIAWAMAALADITSGRKK